MKKLERQTIILPYLVQKFKINSRVDIKGIITEYVVQRIKYYRTNCHHDLVTFKRLLDHSTMILELPTNPFCFGFLNPFKPTKLNRQPRCHENDPTMHGFLEIIENMKAFHCFDISIALLFIFMTVNIRIFQN